MSKIIYDTYVQEMRRTKENLKDLDVKQKAQATEELKRLEAEEIKAKLTAERELKKTKKRGTMKKSSDMMGMNSPKKVRKDEKPPMTGSMAGS